MMAEWFTCQFIDLQVTGSNPGGTTFSMRTN